MGDHQQLLLVLSCVGVLNGILLSLYFLFVVRPKQIHNYYLGGLLAVLSIRIGKSVIYYFFDDTPYLGLYLHIGLSACFLIGPFLYLFIAYFFGREPKGFDWKFHIGCMAIVAIAVGIRYPYLAYHQLWLPYLITAIFIQWIAYIATAGWLIKKNLNDISSTNLNWKSKRSWILSIYFGNLLIWAAYVFAGVTSYILGAISFSFMLYVLIFILLLSSRNRSTILASPHPKYGGRVITDDTSNMIISRLTHLFSEGELFCDPNLNLQSAADHIGVSPHQLSQVINEKMGKNFSQLVHEYRIAKAKEMIKQNDQFTLESIGYDCGYRAKSTFYTAFKKETGTSPAQYKRQYVDSGKA